MDILSFGCRPVSPAHQRAEFTYIHACQTATVFHPFMSEINQDLALHNGRVFLISLVRERCTLSYRLTGGTVCGQRQGHARPTCFCCVLLLKESESLPLGVKLADLDDSVHREYLEYQSKIASVISNCRNKLCFGTWQHVDNISSVDARRLQAPLIDRLNLWSR